MPQCDVILTSLGFNVEPSSGIAKIAEISESKIAAALRICEELLVKPDYSFQLKSMKAMGFEDEQICLTYVCS